MRCFIIAATIATALAADFEGSVRENKDFWSEGELSSASAATLTNLEARTDGVANSMASVTAGIQLVQNNIARLDTVISKLAELKGETLAAQQEGNMYMHAAADSASLKAGQDNAEAIATMALERTKNMIAVDDISGAGGKAKSLADATAEMLNKEMVAISKKVTADINKKLEAVGGSNWGSDEHIFQVTGFKSAETNKYWDGKTYTSAANHGEVRGRKFYKVKFNIKAKGYRTSNDNEVYMACKALSNALRAKDGVERDLRPPCNHYNHRRTGGLGQCIFIRDSYFSHSHNGGGYWGWERAGGGIKQEVLKLTSGYEQTNHNSDHHLVNRGGNSHTWWKAYKSGAYEYTMCTSGNKNYKK